MVDVLKAIIIADAHVGANKFDTHPDRWDAPVRQAFNYAVEVEADLVISAGDFMHKRNPSVLDNLQRFELLSILVANDIAFLEIDGNHERPGAEGAHSALEVSTLDDGPAGQLWQGQIQSDWFGQVKIIGLPWPRPTDYLNDEAMKMSIDEKIDLTRKIILNRLSQMMDRPSERPVILFGHVMLAYGPNYTDTGIDPGLILSKDVVLPYQAFIDAGLTENQIFMGHVHDPKSKGYVGSTQPTDWSEAGQDKAFVELDIGECTGMAKDFPEHGHMGDSICTNGWVYTVTRHSYADQLRLQDIVLEDVAPGVAYDDIIRSRLVKTPIDVVRVTVKLVGNATANEGVIREIFDHHDNYGRLERVIINRPKREAARVDTGKVKMADMQEDEAFELWMKQAGYSADEAIAPYGLFQTLVESSK